MGIFVQTNVSSLNSRLSLYKVNKSLNTTYERLSSGLRINSAKDDAAGLQISDRLTAQINGLYQGNRNTNDAIALAQTIEGGLDEITNILQKVRTLAVQAANGINTEDDRMAISQEAAQLTNEISRIATQTKYNGKQILRGCDEEPLAIDPSWENDTIYENFSPSGNMVHGASGTLTVQVGANAGDTIKMNVRAFKFSNIASRVLNLTSKQDLEKIGLKEGAGNGKSNEISFMLSMVQYASNAISIIDSMIQDVDKQRGELGAIQNRLESSIRLQSNVATNTSDARSRIRDTDFAAESANLAQHSIIQQAATSMLMQANARPQIGLNLIG